MPDFVAKKGWLRGTLQVAATVAVFVLVAVTFRGTRKPDSQDQDFGAYYRAGQAVAGGRSPYFLDEHGPLGAYMYAPAFAYFVFQYVTRLSYLWAVRLFLLTNWIASVACVELCLALLGSRRIDRFYVALVAMLSTGTYLWANLHSGQVGTLLLLACLGWLCLTRAGRPFLGGICLSLAIALKIYPILLCPYLFLRRDWRGLAGVAFGLALLFVTPAIFVGVHQLIPLHQQWLHFCVETQIPYQTFRAGNQSLLGALARLPFISNGRTLYSRDNLAMLVRVYPAIVLLITAALYSYIYLSERRAAGQSLTWNRDRAPIDLSLLLLWVTLAAPRAWSVNFALEVPAGILLAAAALEGPPGRWLAMAGLAGALFAVVFPTNSLHLPDHWQLWEFLILNKHFDAAVLLGVAVAGVCYPQANGRVITNLQPVEAYS